MKKLFITSLAVVAGFNLAANAVVFTGTAIGSWNDRDKESNRSQSSIANSDVNGFATVSWGDPAYCGDKPSYLKFDGAGSDNPAVPPLWSSVNNPFLLGTLQYYNGVQWANTGLDGV
ncbi:MAG: choice-of-anchor K domain-containing protein, partial [bacterium]